MLILGVDKDEAIKIEIGGEVAYIVRAPNPRSDHLRIAVIADRRIIIGRAPIQEAWAENERTSSPGGNRKFDARE